MKRGLQVNLQWMLLLLGAGCAKAVPLSPPPQAPADAGTPAPDAAMPVPPADAGVAPPPREPAWGPKPFVDMNPDPRVVEVELTATSTRVAIAEGLTVSMLAYNGQIPGPLLEAHAGDEVVVHFTNALDESTTVHWHGLRIPDAMDGNPRIQDPVRPGESFTYRFTVPEASSFWYHPHVRSNEQVERGLYGPVIVKDDADPEYDRERYLMLDDILVDPSTGMLYPFLASGHEAVHGRSGNLLLTNGRSSEQALGEARVGEVERWRIVNTANARTMELAVAGATFRVIGTDGGRLREPYETERVTISPGQRFDLEVRFTGEGETSLLSYVLTQTGEEALPVFRVAVEGQVERERTIEWPAAPRTSTRAIDREVTIVLDAVQGANGLAWTINGEADRDEPLFTFRRGERVRFVLDNRNGPEHPFHIHGQLFEVITLLGDQPGLKDTVLVPGQSMVRIVSTLDNPGRWMVHCHILEHAELGMMAEILVEP